MENQAVIVPDAPPKVVLVVIQKDDESEALCKAIEDTFGTHVTILETGNGNEAAKKAKAQHVDAIIVDNSVSGLSGFGLLAELRLSQRSEVPLLLRSGDTESPLKEHVKKLDATFLLRPRDEPFSPDPIITWLRETLKL